MPELPEVETVCRGLAPFMTGKKISSITLRRENLRTPIPPGFKSTLEGKTVKELFRRGKYIVCFTKGGEGFVMHLGMSGRVSIFKKEIDYNPARHDHIIFTMGDGTRIVFNDARRFGMVFLVQENSWKSASAFDDMGPEPLEKNFTGKVLFSRLKSRKQNIKNVLLDQKTVAGIGNIYACDALYAAGIHPERSAYAITEKEAAHLTKAIKGVLKRAIAAGGSSLRDYRQVDGNLGYFQSQFSVYNRKGKKCPDCVCDVKKTGGIQKIVQGGRSTFYCPVKQK